VLGTIFEPYFTTKARAGLGLMIVQRIMRDHGGEIEVHSEPNKGTTFTLVLPRDEAPHPPADRRRRTPAGDPS
jgi:two-component system, sporulation sensor kinase E